VIAVPLVRGKITFVDRRLWPALLAVGLARDRWQTAGLSSAARALLRRVEQESELEASGPAVRELDRRLLIISREVHTDRGAHAKILERWDQWARREAVSPLGDAAGARRTLEDAAAALGPRATLPWT
jgi:hypothetical protein